MFVLKNSKNNNYYFFSRNEIPIFLRKELDKRGVYSCVCITNDELAIVKNKIILANELSDLLSKGSLKEVTGVKFNEGLFYDIYLDLLKSYIEDV